MINIRLQITDGVICTYSSLGHATNLLFKIKSLFFPNLSKYNSVCAALSTLEWTFFYSMENLTSVSIQKKISSRLGIFEMNIHDVQKDSIVISEAFCKSFIIGLKMLHKKHKNFISLEIFSKKTT